MSRPPPSPVFTLRGSTGAVTSLCFLGSDISKDRLISGCDDGTIDIWNLETFRKECTFNSHDGKSVLWVESFQDKIISQGRDGTMSVWSPSLSNWIKTGTISSLTLGFCASNKGSDNLVVAIPNSDSQIHLIDLHSMSTTSTYIPQDGHKYGMCLCLKIAHLPNDVKLIFGGFENGSVVVWDHRHSKPLSELKGHTETVMCLDFDPVKMQGASGSPNNELLIWMLTQDSLEINQTISLTNPGLSSMRIRPDSKILVTGGWDSRIRIFNWKKLNLLAVLKHHSETVQCVQFSGIPAGRFQQLLATGSKDKRIALWDIYSKR